MLVSQEPSQISERSFGGRWGGKFPERALATGVTVLGNQEASAPAAWEFGSVQVVTRDSITCGSCLSCGYCPKAAEAQRSSKANRVVFIAISRFWNPPGVVGSLPNPV